ncbi:hypothetical protein CRYUN_Cryun18bG0101300 [Craigia yunnanensis]
MGFTFAQGLVLVLTTASMLGVGLANKDWGFGRGSHHPHNHTPMAPKKSLLVVHRIGILASTTPIVFKYDPPSNTTFPHSVYLLPNLKSFLNCDLRKAKKIANPTQGVGNGFELVLKRRKPYYFACGERNGFHCKVGLMKFAVVPLLRWRY